MTLARELRAAKLFDGVDAAHLQPVLSLCQHVTVDKGARIFEQGAPARSLYIVRRGRVALESTLERPDGSITHPTVVASVGPGEAFGWSALVEPHILTLSAKAVERSELVQIDGPGLRDVLSRFRDLGYPVMVNVSNLLAERWRQAREAFVYERDWLFDEKHAQPPKTRPAPQKRAAKRKH